MMSCERGGINQLSQCYFNPLPIVSLSSKLVDKYIGYSNCIILRNPQISVQRNGKITYDKVPLHIGCNIPHYDQIIQFNQRL